MSGGKGRAYISGRHFPAFFDDKDYFKGFFFEYMENYGLFFSNRIIQETRSMFKNFCERFNIEITKEILAPGILLNSYISNNKPILDSLLRESPNKILLRVPLEILETIPKKSVSTFLSTLQKNQNVYIELFFISSKDEIGENLYEHYGIEKKKLPLDFIERRENTITFMPFFKEEMVSQYLIKNRMGRTNLKPTDTILSPVGIKYDETGLIRSLILGLRIMHIARQKKELNKIDMSFVKETLNQFEELTHLPLFERKNIVFWDFYKIKSLFYRGFSV